MALVVKTIRTGSLLLQVLVIAACSGGASNGSSGSQPPPPTAEIEPTEATVLSAATFGALVSGSADGLLTPTISISCTNGVDAVLNDPKVTLTVPAESVLTQSECTASVTDSIGRTASATLSITILPKTDIGQVVGIFDPPLKLALPNFNLPGEIESYGEHIVTVAETSALSGRYQVKAIDGTSVVPRSYYRDDIVLVEGDYSSIDFVQSPSLYAHGLPESSLSIASEQENKIYWQLMDPQSQDFSVREVIDVDKPCFIAQTNTYWANDMVVGQVDLGLTVFDIDTGSDVMDAESFVATPIQNIGAGRSLCHLLRGVIPDSIIQQYPGFTPSPPSGSAYAAPLTAVDYNSNELVYYGDTDGDNALDEMGSVPIKTYATGQLHIVQVISRGSSTQSPRYLLVLLTDGNDPGEHRLVQINFDDAINEFTQQILYEWSVGVPVAMLQGPLGGSLEGGIYRADLAVVLGTTEQSFFFDNQRPLSDGFGLPPIYGAPELFDVGVGAGSAVTAESPWEPSLDAADEGVLVSYPDSGNVIYISLPIIQ
jgi:hypothetical protein